MEAQLLAVDNRAADCAIIIPVEVGQHSGKNDAIEMQIPVERHQFHKIENPDITAGVLPCMKTCFQNLSLSVFPAPRPL